MVPKYVHVLVPREYASLLSPKGFAGVTRDLKVGRLSWTPQNFRVRGVTTEAEVGVTRCHDTLECWQPLEAGKGRELALP